MFISVPIASARDQMILKTVDISLGPYNPDEVIRRSLELYGRNVKSEGFYGDEKDYTYSDTLEKLTKPVTQIENAAEKYPAKKAPKQEILA